MRPWAFPGLRQFGYRVIMIDNPWKYETRSQKGAGRSPKYRTMTLAEIKALPVQLLARREDDCALFMWCTSPFTHYMPEIMEAWGFRFSGKAFCWAKCNLQAIRKPAADIRDDYNWFMNTGYSTRANTEDCWLGTRGAPKRIEKGVRELIVAPRREHSRKPDETYERVERLYTGPYCDVFSRCDRPGWDVFGDEAGKFNEGGACGV